MTDMQLNTISTVLFVLTGNPGRRKNRDTCDVRRLRPPWIVLSSVSLGSSRRVRMILSRKQLSQLEHWSVCDV